MGAVLGEGMRARKRRQTRERIVEAALTLFLDRGFEAATVDEIAAAADVSKRTFFDYFPSKEDVVFAWQDAFGGALAEAIAARPTEESLVKTVEEAFVSSIAAATHPRSVAIEALVRNTPTLSARDYRKYAHLEHVLVEALSKRADMGRETLQIEVLAMVAIGALRLGSTAWLAADQVEPVDVFTRRYIARVWATLGELSKAYV